MSGEPVAKSGERLAKRIARAGICSRRDAEKLIAEGKVKVDGKIIRSPAINVTETQNIEVRGETLTAPAKTRLWLYHKPAGLITTHRDPQGRPTVFDALPKDLPRVISVGRLDLNSEGLLLLTNDGALARHIELPATGWTRRYRVRMFGSLTPEQIERLRQGITVDGVAYGPIEAKVERVTGKNCWLMVGLREGKNREIRKVIEHLDGKVNRLIRIAYGPFQLGSMARGEIREVTKKALENALGKSFSL